jgi:hypothetical protein
MISSSVSGFFEGLAGAAGADDRAGLAGAAGLAAGPADAGGFEICAGARAAGRTVWAGAIGFGSASISSAIGTASASGISSKEGGSGAASGYEGWDVYMEETVESEAGVEY